MKPPKVTESLMSCRPCQKDSKGPRQSTPMSFVSSTNLKPIAFLDKRPHLVLHEVVILSRWVGTVEDVQINCITHRVMLAKRFSALIPVTIDGVPISQVREPLRGFGVEEDAAIVGPETDAR